MILEIVFISSIIYFSGKLEKIKKKADLKKSLELARINQEGKYFIEKIEKNEYY